MWDDQAILDGRETVTYRSVRDAGDVDVSVPNAVAYDVSLRDAAFSGGVYQAGDIVWTLPLAVLATAGVVTKPADVIVRADGSRWTVLSRSATELAQFVKPATRNLAIAYDLRHTIDVYRPRATQDLGDAGRREPLFQPFALGRVCRVQEVGRDRADELGKIATEVRYDVFMESPLRLTHEDQIRWTPPGEPGQVRTLEVQRTRESDRIDVLQVVECLWRGY